LQDILKEKSFEMFSDTTFEAFAMVVCEDKRSATLDAGNVKLTYNALLEKAESKEKERAKEETRCWMLCCFPGDQCYDHYTCIIGDLARLNLRKY
jgi:hypothetical protein